MLTIYQHPSPQALAEAFAKDFKSWLPRKKRIHIALSGGSTPKLLFQHWAEQYAERIDWSRIHFYWGDERCVSPKDEQSNYKMTNDLLLKKIKIPKENIHRIKGEKDPAREAKRYGKEIAANLPMPNNLPQFDLVLLGMGADGHTASIFPHQMELLEATDTCAVATHPESGQHRVSLSGPVINNAKRVVFLITGASKQKVLSTILHHKRGWKQFPTAFITPIGDLTFYLDDSAMQGASTPKIPTEN